MDSRNGLWIDPMEEEAICFRNKRRNLEIRTVNQGKNEKQILNIKEEPSLFTNQFDSNLPKMEKSGSITIQSIKEERVGPTMIENCSDYFSCQTDATNGINKPARLRLHDFCHSRKWDPPQYEFCEVGPAHQKMFTCKVTVVVNTSTTTILESFSEPKTQKKSAQDNAAEGVLWYLKLFKYLS